MSYDTYTHINAEVPAGQEQVVLDKIRAALESNGFLVSDESQVVGAIYLYCTDSNVEPEDYIKTLQPVADEHHIDIEINYECEYSDVESERYYVGANAESLYLEDCLIDIEESIHYLLGRFDEDHITELAAKQGLNPTALFSLL